MTDPIKQGPPSSGLAGVLRLTAGLVILGLALLAILVVLDVVPLGTLTKSGGRIVMIGLIIAVTSVGIAALVGAGKRSS
ncbi:MAG: hypothetical protein AB7I33_00025 [Gemmatimonadales bacterium]